MNPLERSVKTQEEKLAERLKALHEEYEEIERQQREEESKRAREDDGKEEAGTKKRKKEPVVMRPLTKEALLEVLQSDPNVTLAKLIGLFKHSLGNDIDKKKKFMKLVAEVATTKTVDGQKVLRVKQG